MSEFCNCTECALLADIVAFRDECRAAQRELIPAADPSGDARMAYGVVADQLTSLIERHQSRQEKNMEEITITVTLTPEEARVYAQFLKRVGFTDYRACASSDAEAFYMLDAGEQIRAALAEAGYAPR